MKKFIVKAIEVVGADNKYLFKIKDGVEVPQDFTSRDALFKYVILKLLGYELEVIPLNDTKGYDLDVIPLNDAEDKEEQTDD